MAERASKKDRITVETTAETARVTLTGALGLESLRRLEDALRALPADRAVHVDLAGLERLNTATAWSLAQLQRRQAAAGQPCEITGVDDASLALLESVAQALPEPDEAPARPRGLLDRIEALGRLVAGAVVYLGELAAYLGLFIVRLGQALLHPRAFRLTSLVHHCQEVGLRAVPIVALMAFLIGVVLAFQGSMQLRQFGAEVFVVDLIAVSILRELGILLTAIIVAGRTASAFTAAIGSMKMREEIDAMRTLGIDPAAALIVPRVLALLLMLPILGLIANIAGLVGGALMSWIELGISPGMFRTRLVEGVSVNHLIVGMVKAPVFAVIIGIIGCHGGMKVGSDAESLGRMTSASVVAAIFAVIVADALFSIFFAQVGI
ncbi:ABC transporter permease [Alkalilacustris brevis]|uniref:ABC transporter permease n=1 Tax=Alkalilacustris brevis TaxID=2026338 RepID=UPI000E0DEE4E|nr:MlaE family lipid ABC transporter permease subunit [Alkalilacustris brevis]